MNWKLSREQLQALTKEIEAHMASLPTQMAYSIWRLDSLASSKEMYMVEFGVLNNGVSFKTSLVFLRDEQTGELRSGTTWTYFPSDWK